MGFLAVCTGVLGFGTGLAGGRFGVGARRAGTGTLRAVDLATGALATGRLCLANGTAGFLAVFAGLAFRARAFAARAGSFFAVRAAGFALATGFRTGFADRATDLGDGFFAATRPRDAGFGDALALAAVFLMAGLKAAFALTGTRFGAALAAGLVFDADLILEEALTGILEEALTGAFLAFTDSTAVRRRLDAGLAAGFARTRLCLTGAGALRPADRRCCGAFCSKDLTLDFAAFLVALAVDLAFGIRRSS